jgi:hypothetical protein
MTSVNWTAALAGGAMIGGAAGLFFWVNGRIAGVSGIFGDIFLDRGRGNSAWRIAFIIGLVLGYVVVRAVNPEFGHSTMQTSGWGMAIAGLLVGYGTRMGCGCTSGHGICGIARLSPRSIAATLIFMLSAMLTAALLHRLDVLR